MSLSRRGFLQVFGTASLSALGGGEALPNTQLQDAERNFEQYGVLVGPRSARPSPDGQWLSQWDTYAFAYLSIDGGNYAISHRDETWRGPFSSQPGVQLVESQADLPAATNGFHVLNGTDAYLFTDFVSSPYGIDPNGSPLIGYHGSVSGFIHVGAATALRTRGTPFMMRDLYVHAPGGTLFDLQADVSTDTLVESCSYSDAAGLGEMASLGTIDGYRVPSFKGCNFENFADGLTLTGSPEKVFFSETPFRGVTAAGVTVLEFDANCDVDIVDITDCYVKGVQSDTEIVYVDPSASVNDIFQYRGTTHDTTVTQDNILTGQAGQQVVGFRVEESHPLSNSEFTGELDLDSPITVTGSGSGPTEIGGSYTAQNLERASKVNGNRLQYDGLKTVKDVIHVTASVSGANSTFAISIGKNGTRLPRTEATSFNPNANSPAGVSAVATLKLETGDTLNAYLENVGGSSDLDVETLSLTI